MCKSEFENQYILFKQGLSDKLNLIFFPLHIFQNTFSYCLYIIKKHFETIVMKKNVLGVVTVKIKRLFEYKE